MINLRDYRIDRRLVVTLILMKMLGILPGSAQQPRLFFTDSGHVKFISDAPLEFIAASSTELAGIINISDLSFSFAVPMVSFQGFNSALQRTHFNENYIESEKFQHSTFQGKIIEKVDFSSPGNFNIRAKGMLKVHGIERDRIIRCRVKVDAERITVESNFTIPLEEHEIKIPSIVRQKIAEVIEVSVRFEMKPIEQ